MQSKLDNIRHSLTHLLAAAVLKKFPKAKLGIGPTIENGFYYDFDFNAGTSDVPNIDVKKSRTSDVQKLKITEADLPELEKMMREFIKQNLIFKGQEITAIKAKKLFKNQPYKLELIKELQKNKEFITIYRTFEKNSREKFEKDSRVTFLDLCRGGHIKNTEEINPDAFKLTKIAGAYWRGNEKNPMLTRIYGVAFGTKKELDEYLKMLEVAERCDHRVLGERLRYFMFDEEIGKGLPLWLPKGHFIRRKLEDYMYELELKNGYEHVLTPVLAKEDLYKKSGHLAHFKDDMYAPIEIENEKYYLKPMNCPHHHSIYKYHKRSYRELPLRLAEFGHVHRYERSGVLSGIVRTRGFTQNDSHIYTSEENLEKEIVSVLEFVKEVYEDFGIKDYWYRLSLPDFKKKEKYGDIKNKQMWKNGSIILQKALSDIGHKFVEAIGEATFYGPKIDIQIKDVYGREDTIATIQVDYYSASRFNLFYTDRKSKEQPVVIIHRAIMGSFERFFAFLLEKTCGNLPVWLAPVQAEIINVGSAHRSYAKQVHQQLTAQNIRAQLSDENLTVSKRIREAEIEKIPYILVVGDKEVKNESVNVRKRGQPSSAKAMAGKEGLSAETLVKAEEIKVEKLIERINREIGEKTI